MWTRTHHPGGLTDMRPPGRSTAGTQVFAMTHGSISTAMRVGVTGGGLHAASVAAHFAERGHPVVVHGTADQLRAVHLGMVASLTAARRHGGERRSTGHDLLSRITYTDDLDDLGGCTFVVSATDPDGQRELRPAG